MYHFISGLPRSGSTLLASLLNQNPSCYASMMSPVGRITTEALQAMGPNNEAEGFVTDEQRRDILWGIMDAFYSNNNHAMILDNNRRWTANAALISDVFQDARIVCCVRSPNAIVDSFERLFQAHPLNLSVIYGGLANTTVYERTHEIMKPTGVLGFALNAFRGAYFGPAKDKLVIVSYDDLCRFPAQIMEELTTRLRLPRHNYQFDAIQQIPGSDVFDRKIATPGLHTLKPKVVYTERQSVLPPDIWDALPPPFWQVKEEATITG